MKCTGKQTTTQRLFRGTLTFATLTMVLCCVSRTVPEERFKQSQSLSAPSITANPADPQNFSFAIVGDLHIKGGDTSLFTQILTAAQAEGDEFIVLLGDIVDDGLETDVTAVTTAIANAGFTGKVLPVIGNHDIFGDGWIYYKAANGPSHYSVDIGNSRFIAIDTADGTVAGDQRVWLEQQLERAHTGPKFILSHYLPFIPGQNTYLRLADNVEAQRLMKLASANHVTAWLGAHYHSYIVGEADGVKYVVAGGGGGRRMPPVDGFFFAQVTVAGTTVSFQHRPVP